MPLPVRQLNNNVIYTGNNLPNVDNVGNVGNAGNVANAGNNAPPALDAANQARTLYRASLVAKEIDVLFTKAAASSVGSLDGAALEKAIADAKLGKSTRKELQSMIGRLVGEARSALDNLSSYSGRDIATVLRIAKNDAAKHASKLEANGTIAKNACMALGIDKLDDPPTREQAEAVETEKRKVFDEKFHERFKGLNVGQAIADALKAQNELSDRLSDLINGHVSDESAGLDASSGKETAFSKQVAQFRTQLDKLGDKAAGGILAVLEEAKFQCDRRVCELETLELTLGELVGTTDGNAEIDESLLDGNATSLMADSASRMHGNATVLKLLDSKIKPVVDQIKGLGGDSANVEQEKLDALAKDVKTLQQQLADIAADGYIEIDVVDEAATGPQQKKKAKLFVDRTFIDQASKQVDEAAGKLKDFAANMRREALTTMLEKSFNLQGYSIFNEKFIPLLKSKAPKAYELCQALAGFEKACRAFIAAPSAKTEAAMHKAAKKVSVNWLNKNQQAIEAGMRSLFADLEARKKNLTAEELELRGIMVMLHSDIVDGKGDQKFEQFLYVHLASLDKAATLLATESKKFTAADKSSLLVSGAVRNLFEGKASLTTIIDARINGLSDGDVDANLDDRNVESESTLGAGEFNSVKLVNYNDGSERVFKADAAGRIPLANSPLVGEMDINVSIAKLNLATMKTAKAFGLEDVVVKTTVGVHDGQSGIFMERAPGSSGKHFAKSTSPSAADSDEYSLGDIQNMRKAPVGSEEREKGEKISAELMRKTTRLEWLDILSGQGDRHRENFFVRVGKDGKVDVKGIDNDSCFSMHRTGLTTFVLKGARNFRNLMDMLQAKCDEVFGEDTDDSAAVFMRLMNDAGLKVNLKGGKRLPPANPDGLVDMEEVNEKDVESFTVDISKISDPILLVTLQNVMGVNVLHVPTCIDEDTYNHLMAMDGDTEERRAYLDGIKSDIGEGDAFNNAVSRLDDSIKYAKQLNAQGKVYGKDKWLDVVRGTTNADSQVRTDLETRKPIIANTGMSVNFNKEKLASMVDSSKQLMSSFYSKVTL